MGKGRGCCSPTLCIRQQLPLPALILLQVISALGAEKTQAACLHTQPRGARTSKRKCTPSPSALTILLVDLNQGLVGLLCSCQAVLILQGKTGHPSVQLEPSTSHPTSSLCEPSCQSRLSAHLPPSHYQPLLKFSYTDWALPYWLQIVLALSLSPELR